MRVVVDEAHTSFLDSEYRERMESLRHLDQATAPKVALSATVTPKHEGVLAKSLGISLQKSLVLRSSTARPNHLIQVADVARQAQPPTVSLGLASLLLAVWEKDPSARGIIFVRTVNMLNLLSATAPFPSWSYAGPMSDEEKDQNMSSWLSDTRPGKWMFATTALLHGVDYPWVNAVIFLESPYGLYEFVQGSGRAGRRGQKSLIAIIHQSPLPAILPTKLENRTGKEMHAMIQTTTCRRAVVSLTMDGTSITCAELPTSIRCDACEGSLDPLITQAIVDARRSAVQPPVPTARAGPSNIPRRSPPPTNPRCLLDGKTAQEIAGYRSASASKSRDLIFKHSGCFACRIVSLGHGPCHDSCGMNGISTCSTVPHVPFSCTTLTYKIGWIEWKREFVVSPDVKRCYFCWLPLGILTPGHHRGEMPGNAKCRYSDSAIVAAWHILHTPVLLQGVQEELGFVPGPDLHRSFREWLADYASDREDIRLLSVFTWLCRRFNL